MPALQLGFLRQLFFLNADLAKGEFFTCRVHFDRAFFGDVTLDQGFGEFVFDVFLQGSF